MTLEEQISIPEAKGVADSAHPTSSPISRLIGSCLLSVLIRPRSDFCRLFDQKTEENLPFFIASACEMTYFLVAMTPAAYTKV